jgi:hypothetical protein
VCYHDEVPSYYDEDLIEYKETIQLHFDGTCSQAWLTLKNYGVVFGMDHNAVTVVTVGKPSQIEHWKTTIDIGAMLDAINVIRLQVEILSISSTIQVQTVGFSSAELLSLIARALTKLEPTRSNDFRRKVSIPSGRSSPWDRFIGARNNLMIVLNESPGAPWVWNAIEECNKGSIVESGQLKGEFVAYFPKPNLILDEERTRKKPGAPGETWGTDTREIKPILSFDERVRVSSTDEIITYVDSGIKGDLKESGGGNFHFEIKKINCFGFRGDKRPLSEVRSAEGLLPGMTRTDKWVDEYEHRAIEIHTSLSIKSKSKQKSRETKPVEDPEYKRALVEQDIFHLGNYVLEQDFKGYLSSTKSVAIAKYFSNHKAGLKDGETLLSYCYAVQCKGGYHLPSTVPEGKTFSNYLPALHKFATLAEQEVAVPGGIHWSEVVGTRMIRCDTRGQFLSGPVFLRSELMSRENPAFSKLFELLSGKSQGPNPGYFGNIRTNENKIIDKTYTIPPFQYLPKGHIDIGANSFSLGPVREELHLSSESVSFVAQPVNTESRRIVLFLNTGLVNHVINKVEITGDGRNEFRIPGYFQHKVPLEKGTICPVEVTFAPQKTGPYEAQLEIFHTGIRGSHTLRLAGTGTMAKRPAALSSEAIVFKEQLVRHVSDHQILRVFNYSDNSFFISKVVLEPKDGAFQLNYNGKFPELKPGASFDISITFEPQGAKEITGAVTVTHNQDGISGQKLHAILTGTGVTERPIVIPDSVSLLFGEYLDGVLYAPKSVRLTNKGNAGAIIANVKAYSRNHEDDAASTLLPSKDFYIHSRSDSRIEPGSHVEIGVTFKTTVKWKQRMAILEITFQNHKVINIALTGTLIPSESLLRVDPRTRDFGSVRSGRQSLPMQLTLTNTGNKLLTITKIEITGGHSSDFSCKQKAADILPMKSGHSRRLTLTFRPQQHVGPNEDNSPPKLKIFHDGHGGVEEIELKGETTAKGA